MNEYRLVIILKDSSITTKQVGEDGLFKIRKIDVFRAYPCKIKSDVQEYFEKLKKDCFNITNFTKDTFSVILLSECSNQEIVDAVKAEIQDTTFTVLDNSFSKALLSQNAILNQENNEHNLTLESSLLLSLNLIDTGSIVKFGKFADKTQLKWFVFNIENNCIFLVLQEGISCYEIIDKFKENLELDECVNNYLRRDFLNYFSEEELKLIKPYFDGSNDIVCLLDETEFRGILIPKLKDISRGLLSEVEKKKEKNSTTTISDRFLLKDTYLYDANLDCAINFKDLYYKSIRENLNCNKQEFLEKIKVHPVIKLCLKNNC